MVIARRIIALSSLCNIKFIAAFSFEGDYFPRSFRRNNFSRHNIQAITIMSSTTSSSPLPDDSTTVRRSPRKKKSSGAGGSSSPPSNSSMEMLEQWIQHDNHSYHLDFLSPTQAYKIRIALVEWYRANRRKLPWRGDAGPYDGSTVGYAASNADGKKAKGKKRKDEGKDIRGFFAASSSSKTKKKSGETKAPTKTHVEEENDSKSEEQELDYDEPREVTAYGVWVSEIMLQQTRVEAVIPYWIKCESTLGYRCLIV